MAACVVGAVRDMHLTPVNVDDIRFVKRTPEDERTIERTNVVLIVTDESPVPTTAPRLLQLAPAGPRSDEIVRLCGPAMLSAMRAIRSPRRAAAAKHGNNLPHPPA